MNEIDHHATEIAVLTAAVERLSRQMEAHTTAIERAVVASEAAHAQSRTAADAAVVCQIEITHLRHECQLLASAATRAQLAVEALEQRHSEDAGADSSRRDEPTNPRGLVPAG
jgi:outer membrane murein-binding lipoprotein Lpp